jgi:Domain of unknown function (DUF4388)
LRIVSSGSLPRFARLNYFSEVTFALIEIRDCASSGRLSVRNGERPGLAHLYFKEGRLVYVVGDKRDAEAVLHDLLYWSKGQVRFDPAVTVEYEDITWQQVEVFTRWLSLLEMHGLAHGIPRSRLQDLARQLTARLPQKPIALPTIIKQHEEQRDLPRIPQFGESVQHLLERTVSEEQREHIRRLSLSTMQHVSDVMAYAGRFTQELTKRTTKVTQEKARQAVEFVQETAKHAAVLTEEVISEALAKERCSQPPSMPSLRPAEQSMETVVDQATHLLAVPPPPFHSLYPPPLPSRSREDL